MSIKSVETKNEGLKRAFMLTIPAEDIEARVEQEVKRIAPQIRMPGFRPGKVPPNLIRKMHGESLRGEALQGAVQDGVQQLLSDQKIRPALQPQVELNEGYEPGKDAQVRVSLEALPEVGKPQIEDIKLDRLTVDPDESAVHQQIEQLVSNSKNWEEAPKKHAAAAGDLVVMDFEGEVDGKPFEGGKGEEMSVEIGSGRLIPGFEDQLVGAKAGDTREVKVPFPEDYPVETLRGKNATFAISVKQVKTAGQTKIDDEFAKSLGLNDLDQLKVLIRGQVEQELNGLTRTHMKRQLLDALAARHDFEVPQSMVEAEYQNILAQLRHEASHEEDPKAALAEIEADADEYRNIAVRRVRLGLLLSEIGAENAVEVTEQEMNRLVMQAASQYQGKDRDNFIRYIQQEPMAAAQLRAPLYEDKVVDFLFGRAQISDRKATRAELEADLESEEGHVHGPNCGHEHDHGAEPKPKKAAASKSKAKNAAQDEPKLVAKEPAKGPKKEASTRSRQVKDEAEAKAREGKIAAKPAPKKAAPKKK